MPAVQSSSENCGQKPNLGDWLDARYHEEYGRADTIEPANGADSYKMNEIDLQPRFAIDRRALEAFSTQFFGPCTTRTPGEEVP